MPTRSPDILTPSHEFTTCSSLPIICAQVPEETKDSMDRLIGGLFGRPFGVCALVTMPDTVRGERENYGSHRPRPVPISGRNRAASGGDRRGGGCSCRGREEAYARAGFVGELRGGDGRGGGRGEDDLECNTLVPTSKKFVTLQI